MVCFPRGFTTKLGTVYHFGCVFIGKLFLRLKPDYFKKYSLLVACSHMQAKTLVLTHFSGRYRSGKVSASAIEADSEDEQRQSLRILKREAEAGVRQGPGRSPPGNPNSSRSFSNHRGGGATVACAFDGFTWRLPQEPRSGAPHQSGVNSGDQQGMHDPRADDYDDVHVHKISPDALVEEAWVRQNALLPNKGRR